MKSSEVYDKTPGDRVRPGKGMEPRVYVESAEDVPYGFEAKVDEQGDVYYLSVSQRPAAYTGPRETVETSPDGLILYLEEQEHYVVSDGIGDRGTPVESLEQAREQLAEAGGDRRRGGVMQSVSPPSETDQQGTSRRSPGYTTDPDELGPGADLLPGGEIDTEQEIEDFSRPIYSYGGAKSIMNLQMTPYAETAARDIHESRSEKAQLADESFNAPIAPTLGHWMRAPNRWDLPGIDTISEEVQTRRASAFAERLQDRGAISEIEEYESLADLYESNTGTTKGLFSPSTRKISLREDAKKAGSEGFAMFTLAHEAGHAAEYQDRLGPAVIRKDELGPDRFKQLDRLSARARGAFKPGLASDLFSDDFIRPHRKGDYTRYREDTKERMADAIALTVLEPRAAQREAPELAGFLRDQLF